MSNRFVIFLILCLLRSFTGIAGTLNDDQRSDVVNLIRSTLLKEPSLLKAAIANMQAEDEKNRKLEQKSAVGRNLDLLVRNPSDVMAGNPNGVISMVEFYDPRCPYCKKVIPDINLLIQKNSEVRFVYKEIPILGPGSVLETRAIIAANAQGAYEKMQEQLMLDPSQPSEAKIHQAAKALSLNDNKLFLDMNGPEVSKHIEANLALQRALGITGTPTFIINDDVVPGAVDILKLASEAGEASRNRR